MKKIIISENDFNRLIKSEKYRYINEHKKHVIKIPNQEPSMPPMDEPMPMDEEPPIGGDDSMMQQEPPMPNEGNVGEQEPPMDDAGMEDSNSSDMGGDLDETDKQILDALKGLSEKDKETALSYINSIDPSRENNGGEQGQEGQMKGEMPMENFKFFKDIIDEITNGLGDKRREKLNVKKRGKQEKVTNTYLGKNNPFSSPYANK